MRNAHVILYKGVKIDANNVTNLSSANLLNELQTKKVAEFINLSLVLTNFTLRVPINYFDAKECNYMSFDNNETNARLMFAFITEVKYISDAVTELTFKIDWWSSYYSNLSLLECFVEREITATDVIGENTLDEGLDVGRVESILTTENDYGTISSCYIGIMSDWNPKTNPTWWDKIIDTRSFSGISVHNNLVSGHQIFIIEIRSGYEQQDYFNLLLFILETNKDDHIQDLHDIFIIPSGAITKSDLIPNEFNVTIGESQYQCLNYLLPMSYSPKTANWNVAKINSFTDYTPANNKCFCYPYNYLLVTNNVGNQNIYKYEDSSDSTNISFLSEIAVCIGCSGRIAPKNYKGVAVNYDESLPLGKFPVCGWTADSFTNWLTKNALNVTSQIVSIGAGAISMATVPEFDEITGKAIDVGATQSAIGTTLAGKVASLIGQFRTASLLPNIEGGSKNNGDINYSSGSNVFKFMRMRSKLENLKIIDDYFTKFGYKINRVKTPNLVTSRFNHFYIKVGQGEKSVGGDIPAEGINYIEKQLSRGLTIWKSHADIGNY